MSASPLSSPSTRLSASEMNATKRPVALIDVVSLASLPSTSALSTLTRSVGWADAIPGAASAAATISTKTK